MPFKCPACQRPLYNRRRADCEFCGAAVPQALRLSPAQSASIDQLKRDLARERELRDIERNGTADGGGGGGDLGSF